jgi:hypothetical protein
MYKLNDSSDKYEVGSSIGATQLIYASLTKYIGNNNYKLKQIKRKLNLS